LILLSYYLFIYFINYLPYNYIFINCFIIVEIITNNNFNFLVEILWWKLKNIDIYQYFTIYILTELYNICVMLRYLNEE
jgi:hypothetical protein